jgi:hypothetical protein
MENQMNAIQKAATQFAQEAATRGLNLDTPEGRRHTDLLAGVVKTLGSISYANLILAEKMLAGQLTYKSAAQLEYEKVASLFSQAALDQFEAWFATARLVVDGDQGFANRAQILEQLRGYREFSNNLFAIALGRVANNSKRPLHVLPEPARTEGYGRWSGREKDFAQPEQVTLSIDSEKKFDSTAEFINGRRNHLANPKLQPTKPAAPTQAFWEQKANTVEGDRPAETMLLRRIFVTTSGARLNAHSTETDWQSTFKAREAAYREMRRSKEGGR